MRLLTTLVLALPVCALSLVAGTRLAAEEAIQIWLTSPDGNARIEQQPVSPPPAESAEMRTIRIDPARKFQEIDGFGFTLTGGSAGHMHRMSAPARASLLRELFAHDGHNIGISYLRVSLGASDLDERPFSYDDLPPGQTDATLAKFSLSPDQVHLIPVLKEILAIEPKLSILASPWSPPAWMKDNQDTRGGMLKPEFYESYANYFVKYIQGMAAEGIRIDAVTVQNEPLHPGNNPSLFMPATNQALFIKNHLGPAFKKAGVTTKIIVYDHNADRPDYPLTILNDPVARQYVAGSAFHLYAGDISALGKVHEAYPDKHVYFTEQWIGAPGNLKRELAWHTKHLIIGATRNWARTVLEWNLTSNRQLTPHTDRGGCDRCLGAVTLDGDKVIRNPGYYIIAHASKFVRPGSVRIDSSEVARLPNVAFKTPAGEIVLIVFNERSERQDLAIQIASQTVSSSPKLRLDAGAVATCVWKPKDW